MNTKYKIGDVVFTRWDCECVRKGKITSIKISNKIVYVLNGNNYEQGIERYEEDVYKTFNELKDYLKSKAKSDYDERLDDIENIEILEE